jgi:hypothetical protein
MGFFDLIFGGANGGFGRSSVSADTERKIQRDWDVIKLQLQQKGPSQLKQALITADKAMDTALKDIVAGESMGERLKNSKDKFDQNVYNRLWDAHKLRNNLVHEAGFEPPYFMLTEGVENIRKGLVALGIRV